MNHKNQEAQKVAEVVKGGPESDETLLKQDESALNQEGCVENQEKNVPVDELCELKNLLLRTQADFENYRKQTERRVEDIRKMASKQVLVQLLSVVDHIELALKSASETTADQRALLEGVELIYAELQALLTQQGMHVVDSLGKMYDPYVHEALMKVDSKEKENTVVEVYQKGYTLHGVTVRHAKVKISSGKK